MRADTDGPQRINRRVAGALPTTMLYPPSGVYRVFLVAHTPAGIVQPSEGLELGRVAVLLVPR